MLTPNYSIKHSYEELDIQYDDTPSTSEEEEEKFEIEYYRNSIVVLSLKKNAFNLTKKNNYLSKNTLKKRKQSFVKISH
jgi:hypothetical protein